MPSESTVEWKEEEELKDLFSVYLGREQSAEKQDAVQKLLGISDADATKLKDLVTSGEFKIEQEVEEEGAFF